MSHCIKSSHVVVSAVGGCSHGQCVCLSYFGQWVLQQYENMKRERRNMFIRKEIITETKARGKIDCTVFSLSLFKYIAVPVLENGSFHYNSILSSQLHVLNCQNAIGLTKLLLMDRR